MIPLVYASIESSIREYQDTIAEDVADLESADD
jgi:hypothetical protein